MAKLTPLEVKNAKPGRHADGDGLHLLVKPPSKAAAERGEKVGPKSWLLRVQVDGKRRDIGLGSATEVSLKDARDLARIARKQAKDGLDPVVERKKARAGLVTFEEAAKACHGSLKSGWRNQKHSDSWLSSLGHIFPAIGSKPVSAIDATTVRDAIEPIWTKIPETARRVLQRTGVVLDYAHIKGWRTTEAALRSVRKGLPRHTDEEEHLEAMPYADCPAYFQKLTAAEQTVGRSALRFTMLTLLRTSEVRSAKLEEFDLARKKWTVPGERMKMNKAHEVPLAPAAIELIKPLIDACVARTAFIFSADGESAISDATMLKVMRDDGIEDDTVHGFRSSFTDWAAETTDYPKELRDACLAHKIPDKIEAAYRRTSFFDKRRQLMLEWAQFLTSPPAEDVEADE